MLEIQSRKHSKYGMAVTSIIFYFSVSVQVSRQLKLTFVVYINFRANNNLSLMMTDRHFCVPLKFKQRRYSMFLRVASLNIFCSFFVPSEYGTWFNVHNRNEFVQNYCN